MDMYTTSRAHTGPNAATADASRMRAHKNRAERTEIESNRRGDARTARVRRVDRDSYDAGAAAYVAKTQMRKAPDQQRQVASAPSRVERPRRNEHVR
jgi:hypothetical protein